MAEYANTHKLYKCKDVDFKKKVDLLKMMIEIYDNNKLSEIDRAYQLLKLCNKVSEFETKYRLLFLNGANDSRLVDIHKYIPLIYNKLKKYKDLGWEEDFGAIRILERKIMAGYEESKMIICLYIESRLFVEEYILEEIGISSVDFNKHLLKVKGIAPKLYNQYLAKKVSDLEFWYDDCVSSLLDIAYAIEKGKFEDGTKFSLLEFWARVPFKENYKNYDLSLKIIKPNLGKFGVDFGGRIRPFIEMALPLDRQNIILNFLSENGIKKVSNTMTYAGIKDKYRGMSRITKKIVDENNEELLIDFDFTEDDFNNIIDYMKLRKIPLIYEIFEVVLLEYIMGNITKETIDIMKYKKILGGHNEWTRN